MATYEQLAGTSFNDVVVPFISENGLGEQDTCTQILTGYTLGVSPFTFTADISALESTYLGPSLSRLIWDMGDGSTMTGVSVTKQYMYPGTYQITTIFTDQNGKTHKNLLTQTIKVYNYIPDSLVWYTPGIADPMGGKPERVLTGQPSEDLTIYRYNSWQSWATVSGDGGYYINLYAQGSKSRPLTQDQYWKNPDTHFIPSWRFVENKNSTVPVERVQTDDNEYIYVKNENGAVVRTDPSDSSAFFAGTSGLKTVNYIDDNSNRLTSARTDEKTGSSRAVYDNTNMSSEAEFDLLGKTDENKDIILFASFDTSKFPGTVYDHELDKYENFKKEYFQIYETQKVGLPMQVKLETPRYLDITANGLKEFPISNKKYLGSPFAIAVRTHGDDAVVCTDDLVPLSSRWSAKSVAFSANDITTDLITQQAYVTTYLSGSDTTFERVTEPFKSEIDFKTWDVGMVKADNVYNSHVIILLTDYNGKSPSQYNKPNGKKVTLLLTELIESQQDLLRDSDRSDVEWDGDSDVTPRLWKTHAGLEYYGYISPQSRYKPGDAIDMTLMETRESFDTPGSYLTFVDLNAPWEVVSKNNKYRLVAETLIDPPTYFNNEVLYYYLANPSNDTVTQIKPVYYREYSYGPNGYTQTYTPPVTTISPGNSGMYGFATDPEGGTITVDSDTDKVIRFYRNLGTQAEYHIKDLFPPEVQAQHYPGDSEAYGYSPSCVSLDKNLDYWITLYDTISTVKVDGITNKIVACAVPDEVNPLVDSRTTDPTDMWSADAEYKLNTVNGRPGEYGEQLINPTYVETCKNNDIIVTYTNTLCSFVVRFDPVGKVKYKYELPGEDRYFPGDICVDVNDHAWVVVESTGLNADGTVDMNPIRSELHELDEKFEVITIIDSVKGTEYTDMMLPAPHIPETEELSFTMDLEFNWQRQEYDEVALILEDLVSYEPNPRLTFEETNTYIIKNKFWNGGEHQFEFRRVIQDDEERSLDTPAVEWSRDGELLTQEENNITGYGTDELTITITKDTPPVFLMVDVLNPGIQCVINVIKKPVINRRLGETFDIINNMSFVIPDNNNNIWFAWGSRYCSRYHVRNKTIDTTIGLGRPFEDKRYHPLRPETYDRRDNAGRRSALEALSFDTANNLLAMNNQDKRLYCINSDNIALSAFINIDSYQQPPEDFTWIQSICSTDMAQEDDFMLYPDSYMTKEQIQVFLRNVNQGQNVAYIDDSAGEGNLEVKSLRGNALAEQEQFTGEDEQLARAYQSYKNILDLNGGNELTFRTNHGANPVHPTGLEEEVRAIGDWTGWRWINKYDIRAVETDETTGFISLTGASDEFELVPARGLHELIKVNESSDFAGVLRSYIKQPVLRNSPRLYEDLLDSVFGTNTSDPNTLGKRVYEKIANFLQNHKDVDTCTIEALEGLAKMVNYNLLQVAPDLPTEIQRLVDVLSVNFSYLRGVMTDDQTSFEDGRNRGPEIIMIYPWKPQHSYDRGDYVQFGVDQSDNKRYFQATEPITYEESHVGEIPPTRSSSWIEWPEGKVRTRHMSSVDRSYQGKSPEWRAEFYNNLPIKAQLVDKLHVEVGNKFVLLEEHTKKYTLVDPMIVGVEDGKTYSINFTEDRFTVEDPNTRSRQSPEFMGTIGFTDGLITIIDDMVTMIGTPMSNNPTITLFRDKVYKFQIDSPGHPIRFTYEPGSDAQLIRNYVSKQDVEFTADVGEVILRTDTHPVDGPIPSTIYYQSATDPSIVGAIKIVDIEGIESYSSILGGVTAYDVTLDSSVHGVIDKYGWGMSFPEQANAWQFYKLYEYIPDGNDDQQIVNSVIDWSPPDDPLISRGKTTVSYNLSSYDEWTRDYGLMDIMFEKAIREGLEFFDGVDSITNYLNLDDE